ncbi:MAG: hypothetical protein NC092_07815, partial [Butyrivibrio sp.]|nr:hypothetical protein [Butyrivibrio sp.]
MSIFLYNQSVAGVIYTTFCHRFQENEVISVQKGLPSLDIKQVESEENIAKYTIKDSVFSDLFKSKKYLIQLYKALHPEDVTATED